MITFPPEFVATRYRGYFWNIKKQWVYSIKVGGCLRPLRKAKPNHFNGWKDGWQVSVNGNRRWLLMERDLIHLKPSNTVITVDEGGITW